MRYVIIFAVFLAGCTPFPALDGRISDDLRDAPYPLLTPIPKGPETGTEDDAGLTARIAALQARADAIRQSGIGALQ